MMKKIFTLLALACIALTAYSQVTINRIVPIVSDNQIKLEISLATDERGGNFRINGNISSCKDGTVIWNGIVAEIDMPDFTDTIVTCQINNIDADLWTPATPNLYNLKLSTAQSVAQSRIGFRKFEMIGGQFYLNGKPIFLRGNAINPPARGIPEELEASTEFARDYVRFLKGMNINTIRIPDNQNWMNVCDEEGM